MHKTTTEIEKRLEKLFSYSATYPDLQIYVSNVVQRIPSYNGDFEEPWYWADYGFDLYLHFRLHSSHHLNHR